MIPYEGIEVPMGSYEITIDAEGNIKIRNSRCFEEASYPHPHVSTEFEPCLGDARASVAKLIGALQTPEALQVLYSFLSSYNPDSAYEKLSAFAPPGMMSEYDQEDNPCEDCDDAYTSYCIAECPHNDGSRVCSECVDYRSDYCYLQCGLNRDWQICSPCENCEHDECIGEDCRFYSRKKENEN